MRIRPTLLVVGAVLLGLAGAMVVPGAVGWYYAEPAASSFFKAAAITSAVGLAAVLATRGTLVQIFPKQTFVITTMVWVSVSLIGALPFMFYSDINYTDAAFETMSAITTTGSTVLVGLDVMPRSVLVWRSILQWLGGIGFAVMAVAILPVLGVGGMRLFRSESSDWSEKATPRIRALAMYMVLVYTTLSIACAAAYWLAGMTLFDAINHSMTTVSTGGYSTRDQSFGYFASPTLEWVGVVFMIAGALPFTLYVRALQDHGRSLVADHQVQGLLLLLFVSTTLLGIWLYVRSDLGLHDALRAAAFNLTSVITTTGFASTDYMSWGSLATIVFFYATFVGGCSGSTSGGFKIFRLQIALGVLKNQLLRQRHPNGVFMLEYNDRVIGEDVVRSMISFAFAFFGTIGAVALVLTWFELDFLTSISAAATAVTNVGPGLGPIVGPAGNFAALPDGAKWALSAGMLLGRLEILTVVVLFLRRFWQS